MVAIQTSGPLRRSMAPEQIAERILRMIEAGELAAGQRLPAERDLSVSLGVSRPTLREALRGLSLQGVVEIKHGTGVTVSDLGASRLLGPLDFFIRLDRSNLLALFEARILLESDIAGLAARRVGKTDLAALQKCLAGAIKVVNDAALFSEADIQFHQIIFEASGNPFLIRVVQSLAVLGRASREITAQLPSVRRRSLEDHRAIYEALRQGNSAAAAEAMGTHLRHVRDAYIGSVGKGKARHVRRKKHA
ncbi:MAG TPA: FadR/GntR family transcriptional regulator [Tepidisphaeraceae bacterium]